MASLIHITKKMTGKMNGFKSINSNPITNDFCKANSSADGTVCRSCYSRRMLNGVYKKSAQPAFERNNIVLSQSVISDTDLPIIKEKYFRFHAHGELINNNHVINFMNIAKKNKDTKFGLWTKRIDLINNYISKYGNTPKNIILIYSEPMINKPSVYLPENFDKVFIVYTKEYVGDNKIKINCGARNCSKCLRCYNKRTTNIIREVLK